MLRAISFFSNCTSALKVANSLKSILEESCLEFWFHPSQPCANRDIQGIDIKQFIIRIIQESRFASSGSFEDQQLFAAATEVQA
jgi:hypothetical protein